MKKFILFLLLANFSLTSFAIDYNWNGTNPINSVNNWNTNANGNGGAGNRPANFTDPNNNFIISENGTTTPILTANFAVSGSGSTIQLGRTTASTPVNFTIPAGFTLTGTINIMSSSSGSHTLTIANTTNPTLGTLASNSTVVFNAAGAQTVPNTSYGNLTISNSGTKTLAITANTIIVGNLAIENGCTFEMPSGATVWSHGCT